MSDLSAKFTFRRIGRIGSDRSSRWSIEWGRGKPASNPCLIGSVSLAREQEIGQWLPVLRADLDVDQEVLEGLTPEKRWLLEQAVELLRKRPLEHDAHPCFSVDMRGPRIQQFSFTPNPKQRPKPKPKPRNPMVQVQQ